MQQSNFGKSLVSFCYTISQYPEIPGRSLCSVSRRARLSPVIKYRGHDCLHLLYLPSYLCSHYHCLSPPHSSWCWSQNTRHHFSGLVWSFLHICKISTKYLLSNNFCVKSIKISKKDDKDEIKFWIYISCYNFQWMKYNQLEKLEAAKAASLVCLSFLSLTEFFLVLLGQFLLTLPGLT